MQYIDFNDIKTQYSIQIERIIKCIYDKLERMTSLTKFNKLTQKHNF